MLIFNIPDPATWSERDLIAFAETGAFTERIKKEYAVSLLLKDETVLSRLCAEGVAPGDSLRRAALSDLTDLFRGLDALSFPDDYCPSRLQKAPDRAYQTSVESLTEAETPETLLSALIGHYARFGTGDLSRFLSYRWENGLVGIEEADTVSLSQLFCLDRQKRELTDNILSFLKGRPANHVLLYGHSGCGKSSLVKALLTEYASLGLRLVQIRKEDLCDLPKLIEQLRHRPLKYLIFMDDLSFESEELGYKALKTILEGGVEKQPDNVLFIATSNRFHIVNESWEDRRGSDVHTADTQNEKLSLSERFGIRISFVSPSQNDYLSIVKGLLTVNGIPFTDEVRLKALQWAALYHGRSGRTAAQFVRAQIAEREAQN